MDSKVVKTLSNVKLLIILSGFAVNSYGQSTLVVPFINGRDNSKNLGYNVSYTNDGCHILLYSSTDRSSFGRLYLIGIYTY